MSRRPRPLGILAAALAAIGLGGSSAPAPAVSAADGVVREFVQATDHRRRPARKVQLNKPRPLGKPGGWAVDKEGAAIDGRGDYRSPKRLRRALIQKLARRPLRGRAWVRLRKAIRHRAPDFVARTNLQILQRVGPV